MNKDPVSSELHAVGHGMVPLNRRDASNSRASGSETAQRAWKNQPTPIDVPSNKHASTSKTPVIRGFNPYAGRMGDTLSSKPHPGNHTASKTPFSHQGALVSQRGQRRADLRTPTYTPKNQDAFKQSSVIDISDEDIGEPIARRARTASPSPDPIDSFTDEPGRSRHSSATPSSSARKPLDLRPMDQSIRRIPPRDGDATRRLNQRIQANGILKSDPPEIIELDDDEPVECGAPPADPEIPEVRVNDRVPEISPPPRPSSTPAYQRQASPMLSKLQDTVKGKVAGEVHRIEGSQEADPKETIRQISDERKAKAAAAIPNQARIIDFSNKVQPEAGVKSRMKPKPRVSALKPDALSQASGFQTSASTRREKAPARSRAQATKSSSPKISLPLEAWTYGTRTAQGKDSPYWLIFDGQCIEVKPSAESLKAVLSLRLNDDVGAVTCTRHPPHPEHPVVMKIQTAGAKRKDKTLNYGSFFKHGAHGRTGTLIFRFEREHPNWEEGEPYRKLIGLVKKSVPSCDYVTESTSDRIWTAAVFDHDKDEEPDGNLSWQDTESTTVVDKVPGPSRSRASSRGDDRDDDQLRLSNYVPKRSLLDRDASNSQSTIRALRSNTRLAIAESSCSSPVLDPDELVLVYPPVGTGAINITRGDLKRLEPGQYLNDTLIEFGLKHWLNEFRDESPELAEQVHVFSSFFYKKLNVKDKQVGYQSVRKWTSKFDLFKKKYIIVPINEHLHWYLAIICNPEYTLQPPPPPPPKTGPSVLTRKRKREENTEPVNIPDTDDTLQALLTGTREATPARSRTGDEADESSVEALLGDCAISEEAHEPSIALEDFGGLQYPQSDLDLPMDVDADSSTDADVVDIDSAAATMASTLAEQSVEEDDSFIKADDPDVDIVEIDDSPMEVDEADAVTSTSAVPVSKFYSSTLKRGKERAVSPVVPHPSELDSQEVDAEAEVEVEVEKDDPVEPELVDTNPDKTWIFTFDSLGSKHPGALNNLALYLQLEAQDKKGIEPANITLPGKKHALVPAQPNFCDCGVYLIHFVRAFMKDPKRATEIILSKKPKDYSSKEREQDWDAEAVLNFRDELMAKAESLSDVWKKEKEQKRKEAETAPSGATSEAALDGSDDEIIVGEIISKPKPTNAKGKGKAKAPAPPAEETKADRLR